MVEIVLRVAATGEATSGREILAMCAAVTGEAMVVAEVTWATEERILGTHLPTSVARPVVATAIAAPRCTEMKGATSPSLASSPMAAAAMALLRSDSTTVDLPVVRITMVPAVAPR